MDSLRKTALVAGIFYVITFISIPTLALYGPVTNHRDSILSSGGHTAVLVGGFLEVIVALAGVGTAVTLYPVLKRQNEGLALGFVTSRLLEGTMIFAGAASLLSLVTLRHYPGAGGGHGRARHHRRLPRRGLQLDVPARTEPHARHQRTAARHPAVPVPARAPRPARPRAHRSPPAPGRRHRHALRRHRPALLLGLALAALPIAAWEFSLGVWLIVKGFSPSPITAGMTATDNAPAYHDATV